MRAVALLTLATLLSLTDAAPSPTLSSPLAAPLLVLRSACRANLPHVYSESALRRFAVSSERSALLPRTFRLLGYNETCGEHWAQETARAAVGSVLDGAVVVSAGWLGGAVCGALTATSRAILRSPPAACAAPHALASTLASLAERLRWGRVRLSSDPTGDDCEPLVLEAERALLAAGLEVRRALNLPVEDSKPYVSVFCDERRLSERVHDVAAVLVVSPFPAPAAPRPLRHARSPKAAPTSSRARLPREDAKTPRERPNANDELFFTRDGNPSNIFEALALDPAEYLHSLVLTDAGGEADAYGALLDALRLQHERAHVQNVFQLHESRLSGGNPAWFPVAAFATESRPSPDGGWVTHVELQGDGHFDAWCRERASPTFGERKVGDRETSGAMSVANAACLAGAAILALATVALTVVATRRALAKRMQRRPRAAVVLSAADFQFPADEQRRVGEGMESMLSWLQQLHELPGGVPQPACPDLLERPVAPSAPSSTCSVTRLPLDGRIRYKGDPVHMKYLPGASLELKRKAIDVLLVMQSLRHENLNPFIGCLCAARPALVFAACGRGTLEAVLVADEIRLDWTFRLSLLTDLVRGMRYLHASPLRVHGRLSSRACLVDARWVLRVSDYGVPQLARAQALPVAARGARDLLWCAPEILREGEAAQGTPAGDVFSFSIIMQEVIVRGEPYCMLSLTPEEIVEKLCRPPPLIRPSVSMGAAPPEAVSVMRQCWSEQPDLRPDFNRLNEVFRHMHRGRKVNIVDSMFEMLEKYSNNLEELIKERTEQLDVEKKKTEQLLNRMLPRSVAERLMLGLRVQPEEFEEVSIYFSDIVGFTGIAARSTPVQVVDLLNDLYTTFDAAIEQYRVYKVETIGDAYMVVGGLPQRCTDHAQSIATMALHLLHLAGRFRIRHAPSTPLHLRIGLHTGPCCAGVVGLTMPRYCLFGDTVNTASRMESTGAAWRVQVSSATAERLAAAGGYRLRSRGLTQVKGKGAMHTYWLLGKEGFDKPLPTPPPLESEEVLFETDCENDSESSERSIERQSSEPGARPATRRSGAVSADSSPPAPPPSTTRALRAARYRYLRSSLSTCSVAGTLDAPSRLADRGDSIGARALRRQWSLERGDALAAAAADVPAASPLEPLALRAPTPRAGQPRYRTRREPAYGADPER